MSQSDTVTTSEEELSVAQETLLSFIIQHYQLTGEFLSAEKAYSEHGIPVGLYKSILDDESCREALIEKGIVFERFEKDDWTSRSLTPDQLACADTMLDLTDSRSQKKKLNDLGIHTLTFNAWLKDPVFKEYMAKRSRQMVGDSQHEVDLALLDRIRAGDLKAIEYYNEWQGVFTRQRANSSQVDVTLLLTKVVEIITEEVTDPQDAMRISNRLRGLIAARNVATALVGEDEPIIVPEIVSTRSLDSEEKPKELE